MVFQKRRNSCEFRYAENGILASSARLSCLYFLLLCRDREIVLNMNPRMRDVAHRCGVSESTVSHVINGTKKVSAKTRKLVEQAMEDLKYHRDSHARRLARGHSDFLGLIISDIENPFFPSVIKAFETDALESGFEVLLCTTNYDRARTENAFRKMIENKSPGVAVMTSRVDADMYKQLTEHGIASVFLDSSGPDLLRSNIKLNYVRGATEAIRYLYNLGHRQFALVAGPQNRASHISYREAIEAAVNECGGELSVIVGNNDVASGEAAVQALMTKKSLPTAILCSNDLTAMSVIRTLLKCGLRVPADISVIGADDIPFAGLSQPAMTTVRLPRERLGRLALDILRNMLTNPDKMGVEVVVETELVIRESSGVVAAPSVPKRL